MIRIHVNLIFLCCLLVGCVSTKKVFFEDIVDTNDKAINIQDKKVFSFEESGVYFSNRFEGARLNDVKKENDSTFILLINPENKRSNSEFGQVAIKRMSIISKKLSPSPLKKALSSIIKKNS